MKRFLLLAGLLLCSVWSVRGQDRLTLREAIQRAQAHGPQAEIAELAYEQAQWYFRSFRGQYLPSFFLTGSAPGLERSINEITQDDGSIEYVQQSQLSSTLRLRVEQALPWTGGTVFVSSRLSRIDLFGDRELSQWSSAPVVIGLEQPLFAFNPLEWERRLEPLRFQVAQRTLGGTRAEIAVEATSRFFEVYIAAMNVELAQFNVAVNDTIYTLSQGRYEIGRIAENDLLQSELALLNAQSALSEARITYEEALENLKTALNLPADARPEIIAPTDLPMVNIDPVAAVAYARQNRGAFLELKLQRLEAERNVAQAEGQNGLSMSLFAQYGLNQQGSTLDAAYLNPLSQQRLGISFSLPLYQWGRGEAEVEAAKAARLRTQREVALRRKELEQEVYFEVLRLRQLREQVRIAAKADTVAVRRFEVARNRYTVGKIDITDLFNAQREKDAARRSYIQTLRQFWTSYYRLQRLTLHDFADTPPR